MDLGRLDLPILVFGGPYGNLQATEALLQEARSLGIPPERIICTGDTVAYCADPAATVGLLRDAGLPVLMGNCEESLAAGANDCGCGFEAGTVCDVLSQAWYAFCRGELAHDHLSWMGGLPRAIDFEAGGIRFTVAHGAPSSISRFVFPSMELTQLEIEFEHVAADVVLAGHSGIPFACWMDPFGWVNAGAIGMPANDGTPRTWYAVIRDADGIVVELRSLIYDHEAAAASMRAKGLPDGYAACLETGLWPSLDVLPKTERAQTGQALNPRPMRVPVSTNA